MPTAPSIEADYKWTYDVRVQPVDFGSILPSGILVGSVATAVTGTDTVLQATAVTRAGGKIVDVVYWAGTGGVTYTVVLSADGNGTIGGQTWKQRVKFAVIVQA